MRAKGPASGYNPVRADVLALTVSIAWARLHRLRLYLYFPTLCNIIRVIIEPFFVQIVANQIKAESDTDITG